jgi:hypothetical protein
LKGEREGSYLRLPTTEIPMKKPRPRSDDADAFLPDPDGGPVRSREDLSEFLGESFVKSVVTGDDTEEGMQEEITPDEVGGPFVSTDGAQEFGDSRDPASEDEPGEPEAFPTAVRSGMTPEPPDSASKR